MFSFVFFDFRDHFVAFLRRFFFCFLKIKKKLKRLISDPKPEKKEKKKRKKKKTIHAPPPLVRILFELVGQNPFFHGSIFLFSGYDADFDDCAC